MERPTHKITTPSGIEVELKNYLTGREKQAIVNAPVSKDMRVSTSGGELSGFDAAALTRYQNAQIEQIVMTVAGSTDNVLDAILNMQVKDYDAVMAAVSDVFNGKDFLE